MDGTQGLTQAKYMLDPSHRRFVSVFPTTTQRFPHREEAGKKLLFGSRLHVAD